MRVDLRECRSVNSILRGKSSRRKRGPLGGSGEKRARFSLLFERNRKLVCLVVRRGGRHISPRDQGTGGGEKTWDTGLQTPIL